MKLEKYHELFQAQVDIVEEEGITIEDESLVNSICCTTHWNSKYMRK